MIYVLFVRGKEVFGAPGCSTVPMTKEGQWFLVVEEAERWVEATSNRVDNPDLKSFPPDVKLFPSMKAARDFAAKWKGHPWWCVPRGDYKIVRASPKYKKVLSGYRPTAARP